MWKSIVKIVVRNLVRNKNHFFFNIAEQTLGIIITTFTISWQALKAAIANPVDSLRNE